MRPVVNQSKHSLFPPVKSFIQKRVFTTSSESYWQQVNINIIEKCQEIVKGISPATSAKSSLNKLFLDIVLIK
jgi:hypothetical protein